MFYLYSRPRPSVVIVTNRIIRIEQKYRTTSLRFDQFHDRRSWLSRSLSTCICIYSYSIYILVLFLVASPLCRINKTRIRIRIYTKSRTISRPRTSFVITTFGRDCEATPHSRDLYLNYIILTIYILVFIIQFVLLVAKPLLQLV